MAYFSINDMSGALPTVYNETVTVTQRKAPTLRILAGLTGVLRRGSTGRQMTWTVKFSGQDAGTVDLDGGAFRTATSDSPQPASLAYGSYGAPVRVSDDMLWVGGANGGLGPDVNTLWDPIADNIQDALTAWVKVVNQALYSGNGTAPAMTGMATSIASTGTYANINSTTYTQWVSTVTGNSGTLQSLTIARVKTLLQTVASNSGAGRPDIAFCRPAVFDAWENLYQNFGQIVTGLEATPAPGSMVDQPGTISLPAGTVKTDGFRCMYLKHLRLYVVEDPDAVDTGATNANNSIFFLNSGETQIVYVPPPGAAMFRSTDHSELMAQEQGLGPLGSLPLDFAKRGRTENSSRWDIAGKLGFKLRMRNSAGKLQDQQ